MEQMTPEQTPQAPERNRKAQGMKLTLTLPAFFSQIGKDVRWFYDVRLWIPVVLVLVILAACVGSGSATGKAEKHYEPIISQLEEELEEAKEIQVQATETTEPPQAPIDPEAEALAILADSVGSGRSDNVKTIIMWVAINRSENPIEGHGKSLLEEIAMPYQWQGYDPEITYSQSTYDIAVEVLAVRDSGGLRPLDGDMLWMVLNDNGSVTVRNKYQGQNWDEKTIK